MGSKILVIEDEPAIITSVSYSLRKEGYEVVTATDGQTGLETARRDTPDLIVLDVMLDV
ncbi:MAG: response regulator, partial [Chloroflexi bacterium]|nr:response regulator [Chloroflexota bacterium]